MTKTYSLLSAMTIAMVLPGIAMAGSSCDQVCGKIENDSKTMLANPKCKNDPSCVQCVQQATLQSQSGLQCSAANVSKKGAAGALIYEALNAGAAATCLTACTMSLTGVANAVWDRVCGYAGWGVTATEIGYALSDIIGGQKVDYAGLAFKAYGAVSSVGNLTKAGAEKAAADITAKKTLVGKMLKNPACFNSIMYGYAAIAKAQSVANDQKSAKSACDNAQLFTDPNAPTAVQACLNSQIGTTTNGTNLAGLYTPTSETFPAPAMTDVNRLAATSNLNNGLISMKKDMEMAVAQGKLDYPDIAKKLASGADVSSVLSAPGIAPELIDALKTAESQIKNADLSKLAAAMGQGDPSSGAPTTVASIGETGASNLSFGDGASPGEGAESLDIDRNPASGSKEAMLGDGDVFHGSFGGSIFDIVSSRIKGQKGNYAELSPEGRMNRLFNGYKDAKKQTK